MVVTLGILVTLVLAGAVLLVANAMSSTASDGESPWRAFRAGWAARREPSPAVDDEPVDLKLVEFLRVTSDEGEGYLHVDELSEGLQRARDRAARALPSLHRS
ncbi:hypothetical protein IC607_16190 [Cellulomonas sp. JH27-2]|nr:hypothetical protein [Cellulomonas sp. JH27-2]